MHTVDRSALLPYSAQVMFDLVNDVAAYPDFLPWCLKTDVHEQSDAHMKATIHVEKQGVKKYFTTKNRLIPGEMIELELEEGPFSHFYGKWLFEALSDEGCRVSLHLEFAFNNKLVSMVAGPIFSQMGDSMLKAFCERAQQRAAS